EIGPAVKNIAVAYVHTPYVAFCADDTEWEAGALRRAADLLDAYPEIGVVTGTLCGPDADHVHPRCMEMSASPLDQGSLPCPQVLSFLADACIFRTRAFYEAGGFWPRLTSGGEERLLALDMAQLGWRMVYAESVRLHCERTWR